MECQLNNRFALSSNKHNWILIDKYKGRNNQNHYLSNLKQLSKFMLELKAKESVGKVGVDLGDIASIATSYDAVFNDIVTSLEKYVQEIIEKKADNENI